MYETHNAEYGIAIRSYIGDSGIYKYKSFLDDIAKREKMSLSGVGAHGQNGVAERAIQTVGNSARTVMLHQALL